MNKLLTLVFLICSVMAITAQDITDKYNLSFEMNDIGYDGVPKQWSFSPSPTVSHSISGEVPKAAGGSKCLMVDYSKAVPGDASRMFTSGFMKIDPNQKYIYSFWLKTEGKTDKGFGVSIGILYFDKDKKILRLKYTIIAI